MKTVTENGPLGTINPAVSGAVRRDTPRIDVDTDAMWIVGPVEPSDTKGNTVMSTIKTIIIATRRMARWNWPMDQASWRKAT